MESIILSSDLKWLEEYIETIAHTIPNLSKLKRVTSIHGKKNQKRSCQAQIWSYKNGTYRISLYVSFYKEDKQEHYSTIDLLCNLAHELAHMQHWTHSPEHKILECTIINLFMSKLKSFGYIDEETEMEK